MTKPAGVVLDASATLAWILEEAEQDRIAEINDLLTTGFALVPELWHAEMANGFRTAVRRGLMKPDVIPDLCELLGYLDIRTDVVGNRILRLSLEALNYGLTSYDVTYLLLARDRGLPLATLDRDLALAAKAQGLVLAI